MFDNIEKIQKFWRYINLPLRSLCILRPSSAPAVKCAEYCAGFGFEMGSELKIKKNATNIYNVRISLSFWK